MGGGTNSVDNKKRHETLYLFLLFRAYFIDVPASHAPAKLASLPAAGGRTGHRPHASQ